MSKINFKTKKGITLIALVVTIIVLLILAGVALSLVLGENGITNRAVNAGKTQNIAVAKEKVELDAANYGAEFYQAKYVNNDPSATSICDYIMAKFAGRYTPETSGPYEENFILEVDTDHYQLTLTSNINSDKTTSATATIESDGKVTWDATVYGSASGGGETPSVTVGPASDQSTITTSPAYSGGTGTSSDPYVMTVQEGKTGSISVAVKDTNGSTTTADSISYTSGTTSVATVTPASETNVSSSTATVSGVAENSNGSVITITIDSVTKYVKVVVSGDPTAVGSTVTYTTKLNNTDLTMAWKVFHKETKNNTEYVWIILGDYLPNSYISDAVRTSYNLENGNGAYCIKATTNRTDLMTAMTNTANWSSLLKGTLNGTAIDYTSTADTNIKAMGSPTLELWRDSWNAKYPNTSTYTTNQLYTATTASAMSDGYSGFYVSRTNNPPTTSEYSGSMSGSEGYVSSSNANALYFPHTSALDSCYGYWLASPSAYNTYNVMLVSYNGNVRRRDYGDPSYAARPVVCLPSSVLE